MNYRKPAALAAAALTVMGAAIFYLNSGGDSPRPFPGRASTIGLSANGQSATGENPAAESGPGNAEWKARPGELPVPATKTIPKIEKVDPKKYTTAPKEDSHEAKIFKLVMELGTPDAEKVRRLLAMMPTLPEAAKVVALEHAAQLIPDGDYIQQRPTLLKVAETPEMREVVMLDVLTRDDAIKMPGLVELMKLPDPQLKTEAREVLEAYLEQDHGDDIKKWEVAVRQWVVENVESDI